MPLRVAWIGGGSGANGGVGGIASLLLRGLLDQGAHVDLFATGADADVGDEARQYPNLKVVAIPMSWNWDRWYSRRRLLAFGSSAIARVRAYRRMVGSLLQRHREQPYDVIFQMSQTELFNLGSHLHELPPVIVFPCVHAAGELRWHRRESRYARQAENPIAHYFIRLYLSYRSRRQRKDLAKPAVIIGMSNRFNELLRQDYGVDSSRQAVLYNPIKPPIDIARAAESSPAGRPLRLLYVARISVRKGVEQIVDLSHRLEDLAGKIELHVIGGATMWSDYRPHLKDLNPRIAKYLGAIPHDKIMRMYDEADVLLLPSHYEPGGIVVGEALSRGVPAVVSDEVGTAEPVDALCCRRFPAGDADAFEREVRRLLDDMRNDPAPIRAAARAEAATHFLPSKIASEFLNILTKAAKEKPVSHVPSVVTG